MKVVIFCPRGAATGGTELLHQLGYKLGMFGFEPAMYYYGEEDGRQVIHPHYIRYNVPRTEILSDSPDTCYIYPEVLAPSIEKIKCQLPESKHVIWWLSVDNAEMTPESEREVSADKEIIHFVQSYYAWDYVSKTLSVSEDRLFYLSDYINISFFNTISDGIRDNVVLFNPHKGFERTAQLIGHSDYSIKWQALWGLAPSDIPKILRKAKVYIDFGNHPGKDRIPREAVACGCRIITGRRGAAANNMDVPIDERLKISDDTSDEEILSTIKWLLENYEDSAELYKDYLRSIREEIHGFEVDTLKLFSMIFGMRIEGIDIDEQGLTKAIEEAMNRQDHRRVFYLITVYRMKGYDINDKLMIMEADTRLQLHEEQIALYLANSVIEHDPGNSRAEWIKERASIKQ